MATVALGLKVVPVTVLDLSVATSPNVASDLDHLQPTIGNFHVGPSPFDHDESSPTNNQIKEPLPRTNKDRFEQEMAWPKLVLAKIGRAKTKMAGQK